jgi:hypothetical protein
MSRQIEPNLIGVTSLESGYFDPGLYDTRLLSSDMHSFTPVHSLSNDPIYFELPALKSAACYRINQAILSAKIKLVKSDDSKLTKNSQTSVANNTVNSLFAKSSVTLNGVKVNQNTDFHYLKSMFHTTTTSSREMMTMKECDGIFVIKIVPSMPFLPLLKIF